MASIRREIVIDVAPEQVWDAVRDIGAPHKRLAPGFVVDTRLDGDARIVTFADGLVVREPIIDLDDEARRLAWGAVGGRLSHYNASMQVFAEGERQSRVVWISDLLPHELKDYVAGNIEKGLGLMKQTLEVAT
jgi:carbon monoxide dehydrogenase subunit G